MMTIKLKIKDQEVEFNVEEFSELKEEIERLIPKYCINPIEQIPFKFGCNPSVESTYEFR